MGTKRTILSRRDLLVGSAAAAVTAGVVGGVGTATADSDRHGRGIDQKSIDRVAADVESDLIALRADIHGWAEVAGEERRTAAVVAKKLRRAGLEVTTGIGGHGVVAVLRGARPGRTVAYRADMDAVAPDDQINGGDKPAHLCGHDIHTTVGVGIAKVLAKLRERLRGNVVFVFQPAEERLSGAAAMLADPRFAKFRFAEIHALHCGPFFVGEFGVMPGAGFAGQDRPVVTLTGPDAADRAKRLATELMAELSTVGFPESPADLEKLVADIQTPDGPLSRFVSLTARPGEPDADGVVKIQVSYRSWPDGRVDDIREDIATIAAEYDGELSLGEQYPAMLVPEREGHAVKRHLRGVFGDEPVRRVYAPVPFSGEDFAYFLNEVPGTYTFLGVGRPDSGIETAYPHFGTFDPDERSIGVGVRGMAGFLANRCRD